MSLINLNVVEVTTLQFLSTLLKKDENEFLEPEYPSIIVSKLTDDIIRVAIEDFIDPQVKLYHLLPSLEMKDVNELYDRKKLESIELEVRVEAKKEAEDDKSLKKRFPS